MSTDHSNLYVRMAQAELVLMGRTGAMHPILTGRSNYHNPRFSPDGGAISVDITEPEGRDVWIRSLADTTLAWATFANNGHDAIWSRDGPSLVYVGSLGGKLQLLRRGWLAGRRSRSWIRW